MLASTVLILVNLSSSMTAAIFTFYALDNLKISISELALISSIGAIGGVLGSLYAKKLTAYFNRGQLFVAFLFANCISNIIYFLSNTWITLAIGMIISTFSLTQIVIHYKTIRQEETPNELLGRVAGTTSMLLKLITPVAFILTGWAIEYIDGSIIFLINAIYLFCLTIGIFNTPILQLK